MFFGCKKRYTLKIHKVYLSVFNDSVGIKKILQTAHTMIGDSRFIKNIELEQTCMLLVKSFNKAENGSDKSKDVDFFIEIFSKIIHR